MVVEPPGEPFGRGILEIHDRVFVAIEHFQIKKRTRPVKQPGILNLCFRVDTFFIEAREGGGRRNAVKTMTVIEET